MEPNTPISDPTPAAATPGGTAKTRGKTKNIDEAVDLAERMLPLAYKSAIKSALYKQYGCSPRTAETIISRAKARIVEAIGQPKTDLRAEIAAVYDSVIYSSAAAKDRLRAAEGKSKLLGLDAQFNEGETSKAQMLREIFADGPAVTLPPNAVPSPPEPAASPADATPPTTDANPPADQAVDANAAAPGAVASVPQQGPVQNGRGGPSFG